MLDSWIILQERVNYLEDGKNVFRLRLRLCSSLYPISERIRDFFLEYDRHVLRTSPPWGSELLEVCFLSLYCCYLFLSFIKWTMKSTSQPTLYKNKIKANFEEVNNSLANCDLDMKPSVCRGWNTGRVLEISCCLHHILDFLKLLLCKWILADPKFYFGWSASSCYVHLKSKNVFFFI